MTCAVIEWKCAVENSKLYSYDPNEYLPVYLPSFFYILLYSLY